MTAALLARNLYVQSYWGNVAAALGPARVPNADYEWDVAKSDSNLQKHGTDFVDAIEVFERPHLTMSSDRDGETRQITIGLIGSLHVAVVWTDRDGVTRLISVRKARRNERRAYDARFGA